MEVGVESLMREKTRPSRIPQWGATVSDRVVGPTLHSPSGETTHWTSVMMDEVGGISTGARHRIWRAHDLRTWNVKQFTRSIDSKFVAELRDIVGALGVAGDGLRGVLFTGVSKGKW